MKAKDIKPGMLIQLKTSNPHNTDGWVLVYMSETIRTPDDSLHQEILYGGVGAMEYVIPGIDKEIPTKDVYGPPRVVKRQSEQALEGGRTT